jgi:TRAP-type C4-dicarboxylate transport system permease small subunit
MNTLLNRLIKFDSMLARVEGWGLMFLVAVMTVVVLLQVIYRYLLSQPLYWSEELARYLFVWISILGATLSVQRRGHFGMDFFFRMFPEKGKRLLIFLIYLLMGGVVLVLLVQGIALVQKTAAQLSPAMEISMGWAYACLPAGACLMVIHLLVIIFKEAAHKTESP